VRQLPEEHDPEERPRLRRQRPLAAAQPMIGGSAPGNRADDGAERRARFSGV
jgi:hypothetical protein